MNELTDSLFKLIILASNGWQIDGNKFIDEYALNQLADGWYQFQYSDQSNCPDLDDLPEKFKDYVDDVYENGFADGYSEGVKEYII